MTMVPHHAANLDYGLDVTMEVAFRRILDSAQDHLQCNIAPARAGDVEGVHQLRVAIRRLRAALLLFRPILPDQPAASLRDRLGDLGRLIGTARDWDVFATQTLNAASDQLPEQLLTRLARAIEPMRSRAHEVVFAALGQPSLADLTEGLATFPLPLGLDRPATELAGDLLDKFYRKVLKRGHRMRHATRPELHELRKAIKNLRYGIEFLTPLYDHKHVKDLLKSTRELQELLGTVNDGAFTAHLADELVRNTSDPRLAEPAATITDWAQRRGEEAHGRLAKPWHKLRNADPFW